MRFKIVFLTFSFITLFCVGKAYENEHKIPPCMQNHYASSNDHGSHGMHQTGYRINSRPMTKIISSPRPYPVTIRKIPTPVRYSIVRKRQPVHVHRQISIKPITIEKPVFYKVLKKVFYPVKVPYKVPVVKKVVVKVPKPYPVLVDRPYPVKVPKPVIVEKKVPVYINIGDSQGSFKPNYEAGFNGFGTHSSESNAAAHSSHETSHKHSNNGAGSIYIGSSGKQYGKDFPVGYSEYEAPSFHVSNGDGASGYSGDSSFNKFSHLGESNKIVNNLASESHTSSSGNSNNYFGKQISNDVQHVSLGEHVSQNQYSGHGLSSSLSNLHFGHDISNGFSGDSFESGYSDQITTKPSSHKRTSNQYLKHGLGTRYTDISTENLKHIASSGNSDKSTWSGFSGHGSSSGHTGTNVHSGLSGFGSTNSEHSDNALSSGYLGHSNFGGNYEKQLSNTYLGQSSIGGYSDTQASSGFSIHGNTGNSVKIPSDFSGYSSGEDFGGLYDNKISNGYSEQGTSNLHSTSQDIGYLDYSAGKNGASNSGKQISNSFSGYVPDSKLFGNFVNTGPVNGHSSIKSTGSAQNIENSDAHYFNGYSEYIPSKNYPIDEVSNGFYGSDNSFVGSGHSNEDNYFDHEYPNEYGKRRNDSDYPQYEHYGQSSGYEDSNQDKSKKYFTANEIASHFSESDATAGILANERSTGYGSNGLANEYLSNGDTSKYADEDYPTGQSEYVDPHNVKRSKCQT